MHDWADFKESIIFWKHIKCSYPSLPFLLYWNVKNNKVDKSSCIKGILIGSQKVQVYVERDNILLTCSLILIPPFPSYINFCRNRILKTKWAAFIWNKKKWMGKGCLKKRHGVLQELNLQQVHSLTIVTTWMMLLQLEQSWRRLDSKYSIIFSVFNQQRSLHFLFPSVFNNGDWQTCTRLESEDYISLGYFIRKQSSFKLSIYLCLISHDYR